MTLSTRPLSEVMGAEIMGIDLRQPVDSDTRNEIDRILVEHKVVVFRNQDLTPSQVATAGHLFGAPFVHFLTKYQHPDEELITVLTADDRDVDGDGRPIVRGTDWHSDQAYREIPARATIMYALETPVGRGKTRFIDTEAAYDSLPEETKRRIADLEAMHEFSTRPGYPTRNAAEKADTPPVVHPVVRTHPESGRKALYVSPGDTHFIVGMEAGESRALLDALFAHTIQPRFQYHHAWAPGDLLAWDNPGLMHAAPEDLQPVDRRLMYRMMTTGSAPF